MTGMPSPMALVDGRQDRGVVLGQDDHHVGAARDQVLDVRALGLADDLASFEM